MVTVPYVKQAVADMIITKYFRAYALSNRSLSYIRLGAVRISHTYHDTLDIERLAFNRIEERRHASPHTG